MKVDYNRNKYVRQEQDEAIRGGSLDRIATRGLGLIKGMSALGDKANVYPRSGVSAFGPSADIATVRPANADVGNYRRREQ
jgi:hypothetical protein